MTDDGAHEQPVTEAPTSARAELVSPAPIAPAAEMTAAVAEPQAAAAVTGVSPADLVPSETDDDLPPQRVDAAEPAEAKPDVAAAPIDVVPATVVAAASNVVRGVPPMLEFASWRLVELVATVAVATVLSALLLPAEAPADAGLLVERLSVTVPLVVLALLVGAALGLPVGYTAARIGSWPDVGLRALATIGASLSPIWLSMLLILVFTAALQWLQPGGFVPWLQSPTGALASLVLPAMAVGLPLAAEIALRMRDALRVAQAAPAIRTAEVMGLTRREAIYAHAIRHALAELSGRMALPLALVVPASLVIENVFYLPGLGRLIFTALDARDFATLQLGLVALVALIALCRFLARILEAVGDPRLVSRA